MRSLQAARGLCIAAVLTTILSGCVYFDDGNSSYEAGSDGWWAEQAQLPPGERRRVKKGKVWPPRPRPDLPPQQFSHIYHSAHAWPYPYVCDDRAYVKELFDLQTAEGWAKQTTLYDYHFEAETNELSVPGQRHLSWILHSVPAQFRNVYLLETIDAGVNQMRLASIQGHIGRLSMGQTPPEVQWRRGAIPGRPAAEVQRVQMLDLQTQPAPVLGASAGGGGAGGGGGGGGAAAGGAGGGGATGP